MTPKQKFCWLLGAVVLLGLLLRLGVGWQLATFNDGRNSVFTPSAQTDLKTYMTLAAEIANGSFQGEFYYQPFYYAVFLAGLYWLFNGSVWAVVLAQTLLGTATIGLAGLSGARLGGRRTGLIAALLTAFSAALVLYTPFHQIATLQAFWLALLFYLTLLAIRRNRCRLWLAVGLVAGCSILTRGNVYFLLPGLLFVLFRRQFKTSPPHRRRDNFRRGGVFALLLLGGVLLVQLPFIVHNSRIRGTLTGPSTAAGAVLTLGNTPEAPPGGREPGLPAGPMEYPRLYQSWMATEQEVSIPRRILDWAGREPLAFLEFQARKFLLFFDYREIPNNVSFAGEGTQAGLFKLAVASSGLIILLALAGLVWLLPRAWQKHSLGYFLLSYFIIAYAVAVAAFYNLSRFRAPILPILAVAGAWGLTVFWRKRRQGRRIYWRYGLALAFGAFFTFAAFDYYRLFLESRVMCLVRPNGVTERLETGEWMQLDHGPQTFGQWVGVDLKSGMKLVKNFPPLTAAAGPAAEVEITFLASKPGRLQFSLNGTDRTVEFPAAEFRSGLALKTARFPVVLNAGNDLTLAVKSVAGDIAVLADCQRDYGRSKLDGEALGAEWVMRLFRPARP